MTTKSPAKAILKQPSQPKPVASSDEATLKAAKNKRHLDIALQHAYLMQHQRDLSAQILRAIETLLDFPATSNPTSSEAKQFLDLVSLFQPLNFDELVEERRIDGKCGYPLCAKEPRSRSLGASAAWKLGNGKGDWCSESCRAKGLFVQSQLLQTPAWERVPGQQPPVVLHEKDRHLLPDVILPDKTSKVQRRVADHEELAMERGETTTSFRPNQVMTDFIVEKTPSTGRAHEASKVKFASSTAVEGYEPTITPKMDGRQADGDVDDEYDDFGSGVVAPEVLPLGDEDDEQQWKDMFEQMRK